MFRIFVTLATWFGLSAAAHAADLSIADIFTGGGDPQTNEYLNMIFGSSLFPVTGDLSGEDKTLISMLMTNFNVVFFAVGMILLVYNVVVGITETAHDGSVLGDRHSAMWAPIRLVVAGALLIPLPGGYNGIQHGVAYVTKAGTTTASFFWQEAVDLVIQDDVPVSAPDYATLDAQFIQALYRMELCMAAYNQEVGKAGDLEKMTGGWTADGRIYAYSLTGRQGACGKIELPEATAGFERIAKDVGSNYANWQGDMRTAIEGIQTPIRALVTDVAIRASEREPLPSTKNLNEDLKAWRTLHRAVVRPFVNRIEDSARETIGSSLKDDGRSGLAANLKANGWTRSGFYYQTIARYSSDASSVQQMLPAMTPGDAIGATSNPNGGTFQAVRTQMGSSWNPFSDTNENVRDFLAEIANTYNLSVNWWNESVARSNIRAFTNERVAFADSGGEISNFLPSSRTMLDLFEGLDPGRYIDPMIGLVTLGNGLATLTAVTLTSLALMAAVPFIGNAVGFLGTALQWVLNAMAFAGLFLSFILPMIPTMIWVIAIGAFLLLIIEAIFAAPLWAMAHLTMDNEGFSGRAGRKGYILLLQAFLTPVLMLFGLLVGMVLFRIMGTLVNGGFYYALSSSTSLMGGGASKVLWMFGIVVVLLFLSFIYLIIIMRSFSLVSEFPARVFRWFEDVAGSDLDGSVASKVEGTGMATAGAGALGLKTGGAKAKQVVDGRRNAKALENR